MIEFIKKALLLSICCLVAQYIFIGAVIYVLGVESMRSQVWQMLLVFAPHFNILLSVIYGFLIVGVASFVSRFRKIKTWPWFSFAVLVYALCYYFLLKDAEPSSWP